MLFSIGPLAGLLGVALIGLVYVAVVVYLIVLASRLVRAVERIADLMGSQYPR